MDEFQCRICLTLGLTSNSLVTIDTKFNDTPIFRLINLLAPVNVRLNDELPQTLCLACFDCLKACIAFQRDIIESNNILREEIFLYKNDPEDDNEPIDEISQDNKSTQEKNGSNQQIFSSVFIEMNDKETLDEVVEEEKDEVDHFNQRKVIKKSKTPVENIITMSTSTLRCCRCQRIYPTIEELKDHVKESHGSLPNDKCKREADSLKRFYCELCGNSFRLKSFLEAHFIDRDFVEPIGKMPKGKIPKKRICDKCNEIFGDKRDLELHMRDNHPDYRPYACTHEGCGKTFAKYDLLRKHLPYHKAKKFACDICGRQFVLKSKLMKHRFIHSDIKPLQCPQCPRTFTYGHVLRAHIVSHLGERFQCDLCKDSYRWKEDLRNHMKTQHMNIFPFMCQFCGKGYSSSSNNKYHEKRCAEKPEMRVVKVVHLAS